MHNPPVRITANRVTLGRLLLLPLPVALVHVGVDRGGGPPWLLAGLVAFTLLGLTDALDGMLARRHGATPLGSLLDPIADKIFLVAAYGVLGHYRIVPLWLVVVLFVRELAVTALRSIALEESFTFRTSRLAKLKTTVQMASAGLMLLIWIFRGRPVLDVLMAATAAMGAVPAALSLARGRLPRWNATWSLVLFGATAALGWLLPWRRATLLIMLVVVVFTLWSGVEYAWGMRDVLRARFRRSSVEALRLAGLSLAVPLCWLPGLQASPGVAACIMAVLAAEIAAGGLDNSLVQAGVRRAAGPDILRSALQAWLGVSAMFVVHPEVGRRMIPPAAGAVLLVTLGDIALRAFRHREHFRGPAPALRAARREA